MDVLSSVIYNKYIAPMGRDVMLPTLAVDL